MGAPVGVSLLVLGDEALFLGGPLGLQLLQLVQHGVDGVREHVLDLLLHEVREGLEADGLPAQAGQRAVAFLSNHQETVLSRV